MSRLNKDSGQVLILAIAILVILLIGVLFLFDLSNVVRGKVKVNTAEQAAALTGANWQRETLNLIGELNLLKASNVMIDEYLFPEWKNKYPDDFGGDGSAVDFNNLTPEQLQHFYSSLQAVNRSLTEIQARVAFITPLIGFGAAQQSAKNNGMNVFDDGDSGTLKHQEIRRYADKLRNGIDDAKNEYVGYYRWRNNYLTVLDDIVKSGIAMRPSGRFPGLEGIRPVFMGNNDFYMAILQERWCERYLLQLVKYPDSFFDDDWWRVSYLETRFPDESPIYAVGVEFEIPLSTETEFNQLQEDAQGSIYGQNLTPWAVDNVEKLLPNFTWCGFDATWYPESVNYYGPDLEIWRKGYYLRGDLKSEFITGGATAYAETYHKMNLLSKYEAANHDSAKTDEAFGYENIRQNMVRESSRETKVMIGSDDENSTAGAVAKVLGKLAGDKPPHESRVVLPVFNDTAIIPSTMTFVRPARDNFSSLERFLVWLGSLDPEDEDLFHHKSDPPAGTTSYLSALQLLSDPKFRKKGYNHNYHGVVDEKLYFSDTYKYDPDTNPTGAGYLQQVWLGVNNQNKNDGSEITVRPYTENRTAHQLGTRFFVKENGRVLTNEDVQCYTTMYSPGTGGSSVNTGPPRL